MRLPESSGDVRSTTTPVAAPLSASESVLRSSLELSSVASGGGVVLSKVAEATTSCSFRLSSQTANALPESVMTLRPW